MKQRQSLKNALLIHRDPSTIGLRDRRQTMKNQNQRIQSENSEIEAQPQFEATPYDEFIEGFAKEAPILIACDAEKESDNFSQQLRLSIEEIVALEDGGYEAGIEMGRRYRRLHPLQRLD